MEGCRGLESKMASVTSVRASPNIDHSLWTRLGIPSEPGVALRVDSDTVFQTLSLVGGDRKFSIASSLNTGVTSSKRTCWASGPRYPGCRKRSSTDCYRYEAHALWPSSIPFSVSSLKILDFLIKFLCSSWWYMDDFSLFWNSSIRDWWCIIQNTLTFWPQDYGWRRSSWNYRHNSHITYS